jgi:hypothetical protein
MDGHEHPGLSDDALERDIEAALGVEPSPEFLPRVRARIAAEQVGSSRLWWGPWSWVSAAVVVALAAGSAWMLSAPNVDADRRVAAVSPPPPLAAPAPRTPAPVPEAIAVSPPVTQPRAQAIAPAAESRVLVSSRDAEALEYLVSSLNARRVEPSAVPELGSTPALLPPIDEIVLEPITLSPLVRLDSEEGVRQ